MPIILLEENHSLAFHFNLDNSQPFPPQCSGATRVPSPLHWQETRYHCSAYPSTIQTCFVNDNTITWQKFSNLEKIKLFIEQKNVYNGMHIDDQYIPIYMMKERYLAVYLVIRHRK